MHLLPSPKSTTEAQHGRNFVDTVEVKGPTDKPGSVTARHSLIARESTASLRSRLHCTCSFTLTRSRLYIVPEVYTTRNLV